MGINVNTTIPLLLPLALLPAGAAGILVGVYYNSINPLMGVMLV